MGEVYRARDSKLGRDVAIKVLPDSVALDAQRLARFEREVEAMAGHLQAVTDLISGVQQTITSIDDSTAAINAAVGEQLVRGRGLTHGHDPVDDRRDDAGVHPGRRRDSHRLPRWSTVQTRNNCTGLSRYQ